MLRSVVRWRQNSSFSTGLGSSTGIKSIDKLACRSFSSDYYMYLPISLALMISQHADKYKALELPVVGMLVDNIVVLIYSCLAAQSNPVHIRSTHA
jgi:hypothetical protein